MGNWVVSEGGLELALKGVQKPGGARSNAATQFITTKNAKNWISPHGCFFFLLFVSFAVDDPSQQKAISNDCNK